MFCRSTCQKIVEFCHNGYKLTDMGSPEAFRRFAVICAPDGMGRW